MGVMVYLHTLGLLTLLQQNMTNISEAFWLTQGKRI